MDRPIIYPAQVPADTDLLTLAMATMRALGGALAAAIGTGSHYDGLAVTPGTGLEVLVGPGSMVVTGAADAADYGSLGQAADSIVKMAINKDGTVLPASGTFTAPTTPGQSVNILVQAAFAEVDSNPVLIPYMNASDPTVPLWGPSNDGVAQATLRAQTVTLSYIAGTPAATGTQATPAAAAGHIPVAVVTIDYGQTAVTIGNIVVPQNAPKLWAKLGAPAYYYTSLADNSAALTTSAWVQLLLAGKGMNAAVFTASGTFTVPAGITHLRATVIGAGGSSGSTGTASGSTGGGGGSGGASIGYITVTPGAAVTVTVGLGGALTTAGSGSTGVNGNAGGTSSFGTYLSATGGSGGNGSGATPAGGEPGIGTGGNLNYAGNYGQDGALPGNTIPSGQGGTGFFGGGGRAQYGVTFTPVGALGNGQGSGGSSAYGTTTAQPGCLGVNGIVIIEW